MEEVPRQGRLQARRKRNGFASSSPIRIQIEDDIHVDIEGRRTIEAETIRDAPL